MSNIEYSTFCITQSTDILANILLCFRNIRINVGYKIHLRHLLVTVLLKLTCSLSKIGMCVKLCNEGKASLVVGASQSAYQRGDYEKCYLLVAPYIEADDDYRYGSIKYIAALLYYYGYGVTLNRSIASRLFTESAVLGNEDAKKHLSQHEN